MKKFIIAVLLILIANLLLSENNIDKLDILSENNEISNDSLFTILSNWQYYPQVDSTDTFITTHRFINDTTSAPFIYYIPPQYDTKQSTPLLVYLHGGVGRKEFVDGRMEFAQQSYCTEIARRNNWIVLYPFANIECMWWDEAGMQNIKEQILFLKQNYNIDDDKVYLTGVSDGGSGSYHFALTDPDYFASFNSLIGMLTVGNNGTEKSVFVSNLQNRFIYAINNDEDGLYPAAEMRSIVAMARNAGADILFKEYIGFGHNVDYISDEIENITFNMKTNPRYPFKNSIYWEASEYGKCDWIAITKIDTLMLQKEWQKEHNIQMKDERLRFGFRNNNEYEGEGTLIDYVMEGNPAFEMGLKKGDIIIKMDETPAENIKTLLYIRNNKVRGDEFILTVLRDAKEIILKGKFPEAQLYDAIYFGKPSGAVKAECFGNHFEIITSRVAELEVYIHPLMVNLDNPVTITINGKMVFQKKIKIDRDFMVENFTKHLDKTTVWTNRIKFQINE